MTIRVERLPQPFAARPTNTGREMLALLDQAWELTRDAFARSQVRAFLDAELASRKERPPGEWHPWVPGLAWWVPRRALKAHRLPPPPQAILVLHDMLALRQVPGILAAHHDDVVRRIMKRPHATLWELRGAALYAGAGITVECGRLRQCSSNVRIRSPTERDQAEKGV